MDMSKDDSRGVMGAMVAVFLLVSSALLLVLDTQYDILSFVHDIMPFIDSDLWEILKIISSTSQKGEQL